MPDITFSATMDEKDVQRALQNMVKENAKLRAEIGMGVQESKAAAAQEREWQKLREKATKDATAQMRQLSSAAQQIKDSVATPFEEAKKKVAELREHLQAGRLSVDEYRKAYAAVGREMKEASRDHAAEAEAAKAAATAKAEAARIAAEAEREQTTAMREAIATARLWSTAEDIKAEKLAKLDQALKLGTIDTQRYNAAVVELNRDLSREKIEAEAAEAAEKAHSQALREATAIAEKYATKEERVAAELKRLNTLKDKGVLSSKDYARAVEAEQQKLSETGNAADKSGGLIGGLTTKMGTFVSGLASGAAVIAVMKAEYDALIERQGKSRDATLDLAGAQSAALDNLDTSMTPEDFAKQMREVSKDLGMSEKDLTIAASSALSAKGDKTAADAIDAVTAAAKLNRFAPDQLPAMAGSALDLGKHLNMQPEEALGFLLGTQRTARTVSLKGVTENIAPGIIGGVNMGLDKENAAAVAASLSGTSVDPTGAQTGTTMSALFMQLREFGKNKEFMGGPELQKQLASLEEQQTREKETLKERFDKASIALSETDLPAAEKAERRRQLEADEKRANAQLKARQTEQRTELENKAPELDTQQVLKRLQADPALREQFLKDKTLGGFGATFERKMQTSVEQLLTPGTQGYKDYQNALKTQQTLNPQQMFDQTVKAKDSMPAIRLAIQDQKFGNTANQLQLADEKGAQSAIIRDRLSEIRDSMGKTAISSKLDTVINDFSSGGVQTEESAIKSLEGLRSGLKPKRQAIWDQMQREETFNFNDAADKERFNATAKERYGATAEGKQDALLQALIDEIKATKRDGQQQNNQVANEPRGIIPADERPRPESKPAAESPQPVQPMGLITADETKKPGTATPPEKLEQIEPRGIIPADEGSKLALKPAAESSQPAQPMGIIPVDKTNEPARKSPPEASDRGEPRGNLPAEERTKPAAKPAPDTSSRVQTAGVIPAEERRKLPAQKPAGQNEAKGTDSVGTISAGSVKLPKRAPTAAEQEYAAAVQDLSSGTTKKKRDRIFNAEQTLAVEMPPEFKNAVDHQTAVLERIAAQSESNSHAGRVAARAEGRP